jgi:hypothetical protein
LRVEPYVVSLPSITFLYLPPWWMAKALENELAKMKRATAEIGIIFFIAPSQVVK